MIHRTGQILSCQAIMVQQAFGRPVWITVHCGVQDIVMLGCDIAALILAVARSQIAVANVQIVKLRAEPFVHWRSTI